MAENRWCGIRDALLDRLCAAVNRHADSARMLQIVAGRQLQEFQEAEVETRACACRVSDVRSEYEDHRREHGC